MAIAGFCRNANTDGPTGKDTGLGIVLYDVELRNRRTGAAPITADVDVFVTAVLPVAGSTQTFTVLTQPDVPRNVTMDIVDANSSIQRIQALVKGLDPGLNSISETLTSLGNGSAQVIGSELFYQIDSITAVTEGTVGGADTVSFGCGTGLAIPYRLGAETDILAKRVDGTQDTTGVVTINANGWARWVPASVPNATRKFFCTLKSTFGL